jgi:hypothetical protein
MSVLNIPIMLILLIFVISIILVFVGSIVKDIIKGKGRTAIIKIITVAAVVIGSKLFLNYSTTGRLTLPWGAKPDSKYIINLNKEIESSSGTKVKINKVFLDLKYVSLTMGVKGEDKLVALELKKRPEDEKPLKKLQGQWLGGRLSFEYGSYGIPYEENEFIDPIYIICYLSNGEELAFEVKDVNNVGSRTEFISIDKEIELDRGKLTIESMTRAMNYTNISAKSERPLGEMEVSILSNNVESEKTSGHWSGGGSTYNYDFSFKPIEEGNITLKITMKNTDRTYYLELKNE